MKNKFNYCALAFALLITVLTSCRKQDPIADEQQKMILSKKMNIVSASSPISFPFFEVDSIGRDVQFVTESPNATSEQTRLAISRPPSEFYLTGFMLPPLDTLTINAELIQGTALPRLLVGTPQLFSNIGPKVVQLNSGENKIVSNNGGLIWITYSSSPVPASKTKLTFISGHKRVPVFIKNTTTLSEWQAKLQQADPAVSHVVLLGQRVNMVVPRNMPQLNTQDNNIVLETSDRIWDYQDGLTGLDPSERLKTPHLVLDRYYAPGEGAAWPQATSFSYDSYFTETYAKSNSWLQRHEFGHHHQTRWDFHEQVIADFFGISTGMDWGLSRNIIANGGGWKDIWPTVKNYFNKPDSLKDYSRTWTPYGTARYIPSAMLIQLKLAYGNAFYIELHKQTRAEQPKLPEVQSRYRYLMVKACKISKNNLTKFFKKWGLRNDLAYQEIAKLNLPEPDVDPSTKTDDPTFSF